MKGQFKKLFDENSNAKFKSKCCDYRFYPADPFAGPGDGNHNICDCCGKPCDIIVRTKPYDLKICKGCGFEARNGHSPCCTVAYPNSPKFTEQDFEYELNQEHIGDCIDQEKVVFGLTSE